MTTRLGDDGINEETSMSRTKQQSIIPSKWKSRDNDSKVEKERTCVQWFRRNIVHAILVLGAIASLIGAILGSLDSCTSDTQNVTKTILVSRNISVNVTVYNTVNTTRNVTRNVSVTTTTVTPLAVSYLVDGSGSMCYNEGNSNCPLAPGNPNCGCTSGACPTTSPDQNYCMSDANCACDSPDYGGDKWTPAKNAIKGLNDVLNSEMNANETNKYQAGLIQWSALTTSMLKIESPMSTGNASVSSAAEAMTLRTGGTYWGTGLCQGYKMLQQGAATNASKLIVLVADGDLSETGTGNSGVLGWDNTSPDCSQPDVATRGSDGVCNCDYLWNDASVSGYTSTYDERTTEYVEEFVKSMNIYVLSILVASETTSISNVFRAASCDGIDESVAEQCDYFFRFSTFTELSERAKDIASFQRNFATTIESRTTEEISEETTSTVIENTTTIVEEETDTVEETSASKVTICSLDFLYALIAFVPFLIYLLYRTIVIKSMSKTIKKTLYEMIRSKELDRGDKHRLAHVATKLLLPRNYPSDIDYWISYFLHLCPCLKPVKGDEFERLVGQTTIAL